jgi:hypothetical protein
MTGDPQTFGDTVKRRVVMTLVCVVGVAVVLCVSCVKLTSPNPKAQFIAAQEQLAQFQEALRAFKQVHGRFPSLEEGLAACIQPGEPLRVDPWGHAYRYRLVEGQPVVDSAGPDGVFDTKDDIK